ncbi:hypothetical protein PTSG_10197 [Salpingoeca rosetta]|uniref:PX domain-containing protein n=1 Tax=Salpingoeca rosetta (strain ATCC 50818 / BSB-021) TaxID=946362 RepID=F2UQL0_SALR5|nr:uncharacterized protein PTSG_10197 [Salpingoeca rosetta]EGD79915.1 hypothetical protein PTSG_10197 [Salpingoeca rosetta]|eukprot:XP_004988536.1 hypothetical protein PTSG_10197 [Salpingoeca rosetta]
MSDTEVQDVEEATHDISLSDDDGDRAPPQDAAEEAEEPQQQEENEADDNDDATAADAAEPAVLSVSPSEEKDEHVDVSLSDDEPQPPADDDQEEQPAAESTKEENEQDDAALQQQEQEEAEEEEEKQQQKDEPATATSDEQAAAPSSPSSASTSTARAHKASVSSVSSQHKHKEKLDINVGSPKKVGEGMSSYIVYTVHTKTDMESYRPMDDITVEHRYSDFHNLFKLLVADHPGVIVPPPPPKDALSTGIGKFKSSTEDISPFLERRARALQRFMRKVAEHPILRHDDNVKTFLTTETKLAKPKTSTLSNIAQKLASYVESEEWFADTTQEVDVIEAQLKQLHTALQSLVTRRKELSGLMTAFAERFSALADSEEMETLSGAMHQLADVEAKVANLHAKQRDREFYDLTGGCHRLPPPRHGHQDCVPAAHLGVQGVADGRVHPPQEEGPPGHLHSEEQDGEARPGRPRRRGG